MTASATREAPTRSSARRWSGGLVATEKIQPWHWQRLAVVYVRQSTPQQVLDHQASTRLQYGLTERAIELGWAQAQVVVIDDDQGTSGTSVAGRPGFQRLVADVSLDRVGLILGIQMSRLARSCAAWSHLLEVCAVFSTLLADLDGVDDPAQFNDRLLLGLKGARSEAELHLMQQRLRQGLLAKARRGELALLPPLGYVRRPDGALVLDPDEQVQQVVRLMFHTFAELGTVHAVLRYLVAHQIQVGLRESSGRLRLWPPTGRSPSRAGRPTRDRSGRRRAQRVAGATQGPPAGLHQLGRVHRQRRPTGANRARATSLGVAREGAAVLSRLASCAHCGRRMTVHYTGDGERHYFYVCTRQHSDYGLDRCQHVAGPPVDALVASQVLAALQPAALELSLEAALHLEQERAELDRLWQQRLERAAYAAERAGRQFHLVEPEHRLVARSLEREWEANLAAQLRLEDEYQQFQATQPQGLTADDNVIVNGLMRARPGAKVTPQQSRAASAAVVKIGAN